MSNAVQAKTRYRRFTAHLALLIAILAGAGIASASSASATSTYVKSNYYSGVNLRTCSNTACTSIHYMPNGTGVTMQCWLDDQWVNPPSSNYGSARWFGVWTAWGFGYVHSSLVFNQTSVGHC